MVIHVVKPKLRGLAFIQQLWKEAESSCHRQTLQKGPKAFHHKQVNHNRTLAVWSNRQQKTAMSITVMRGQPCTACVQWMWRINSEAIENPFNVSVWKSSGSTVASLPCAHNGPNSATLLQLSGWKMVLDTGCERRNGQRFFFLPFTTLVIGLV